MHDDLASLRKDDDDARRADIEWPTVLLAMGVYASWLLVTAVHASLPFWLLALVGGMIVTWHGSLQHEMIHGHPTGSNRVNGMLGVVPLSLWLPFTIYHRSHLAHHRAEHITHPLDDPESHYVSQAHGWRARLATWEGCLIARLILGPPIRIMTFLLDEAVRGWRHPLAWARDWAPHMLALSPVLWWLDHVHLSIGAYALAFIYPGTALTLLRSFAEHRADADAGRRAVIVRRGGLFRLLFLNNNLHAVHHARPDLPWYRLPAYLRRHEHLFTHAPVYESYADIVRRFAWAPNDGIVHPAFRRQEDRA
jgi:fatty acid desaturase